MNGKLARNVMAASCISVSFMLAASLWPAHATATGEKLFFWKTSSDKATVYLIGSLHVAKTGIYPLDPKIEEAFADADTLVVEVNVLENSAELAAKMQAKAKYQAGESLDKHVSKELFDVTVERMAKYGIPRDMILSMKPWFIGMLITLVELQRLGGVPQKGIDVHFLQQAEGKKTIAELEGAEEQINLFDSLNEAEQEQLLKFTQKDLDNLARHFEELVTAWNQGDGNNVAALLHKPVAENPVFEPVFKKFFDDRNRTMAAKIESYLKTDHTYFIVVGAGHLVGDSGIVKLLGQQFTVDQGGR